MDETNLLTLKTEVPMEAELTESRLRDALIKSKLNGIDNRSKSVISAVGVNSPGSMEFIQPVLRFTDEQDNQKMAVSSSASPPGPLEQEPVSTNSELLNDEKCTSSLMVKEILELVKNDKEYKNSEGNLDVNCGRTQPLCESPVSVTPENSMNEYFHSLGENETNNETETKKKRKRKRSRKRRKTQPVAMANDEIADSVPNLHDKSFEINKNDSSTCSQTDQATSEYLAQNENLNPTTKTGTDQVISEFSVENENLYPTTKHSTETDQVMSELSVENENLNPTDRPKPIRKRKWKKTQETIEIINTKTPTEDMRLNAHPELNSNYDLNDKPSNHIFLANNPLVSGNDKSRPWGGGQRVNNIKSVNNYVPPASALLPVVSSYDSFKHFLNKKVGPNTRTFSKITFNLSESSEELTMLTPSSNQRRSSTREDNIENVGITVAIVCQKYPKTWLSVDYAIKIQNLIRVELLKCEPGQGPKFFGSQYKDGVLYIVSADRHSLNWLTELVRLLQPWKGAHVDNILQVFEYNEPMKRICFEVHLPLHVYESDPFKILGMLKIQNSLRTEKWTVVSSKLTESGQILKVLVDESSALTLEKSKFKPFLELTQVVFIHSSVDD